MAFKKNPDAKSAPISHALFVLYNQRVSVGLLERQHAITEAAKQGFNAGSAGRAYDNWKIAKATK